MNKYFKEVYITSGEIRYALNCQLININCSATNSNCNYSCFKGCNDSYRCKVFINEPDDLVSKDWFKRINFNDKAWALQNLQSTNPETKIVAKYIIDENK